MRKRWSQCRIENCKGANIGSPYSLNQCRLCWKKLNPNLVRIGNHTPDQWIAHLTRLHTSPPKPPCRHEGAVLEFCTTCGNKEARHVRDCDIHERCIRGPINSGNRRVLTQVCYTCPDYQPETPGEGNPVKWSYGITTVLKRRDDLLPRTLASLKAAGFDSPRLFVDGCDDSRSWHDEFGLPVTARGSPNVRTAGNWVLSMYELWAREPNADYYALFQDDLVTCLNLRRYVETSPCPQPGYMNLYTFPKNQRLAPRNGNGGTIDGWFPTQVIAKAKDDGGRELSFQTGFGAVGLVFTREGVQDLLGNRELVGRFLDPHRGHRSVDGGIVHVMNKMGYVEYCHSPSLVQHTGQVSSMGNKVQPLAESFRGEGFDLLTLLKRPAPAGA